MPRIYNISGPWIDTTVEGPNLNEVSVVQDFPDVFPEELPRLPPTRELDFDIDLALGTTPISIPPYQMALAELKELKV